jgi:Tol biopolymer transport system component
VYSVVDLDNDIWRIELPNDGGVDEPERSVRLIASSQRERFPVYSPDGSRIAFLSDRSGHREVWVTDAEGRSPVQWTDWRSSYVWRPAWSPDGRSLAYSVEIGGVTRAHVQDGPLATARALTHDDASDDEIGWSRDSRTVYVSSLAREAEPPSIWAVDTGGARPPRLVAPVLGQPLGEDPSASALFVAAGEGYTNSLFRVALDGSGHVDRVMLDSARAASFTLGPDGVYFVAETGGTFELKRWRFADGQVEALARIAEPEFGISVSPDGRFVLVARIGLLRSDLMVVDDLR